MYSTDVPFNVIGHVHIADDLGDVHLDKFNAVHPQNMARIIARALSNENNFHVHRIAFGNGGTTVDAAFTITFKPTNDGQPPDIETWESRLYNETYSEIIDDSSTAVGSDPGSAGPRVGNRAGGGASPASDPATIEHVSGPGVRSRELGLTSEVVTTVVLNPNEPNGQLKDDQTQTNIDSSFTFDEMALYTTGKPAKASSGSQDVDVNDKTSTDQTLLLSSEQYSFVITVDGGTPTTVTFQPPEDNPTYGELCEALNNATSSGIGIAWNVSTQLPGGAKVSITDRTYGTYPSISGAQTYGYLRFVSGTAGANSSIALTHGGSGSPLTVFDMFENLPGVIVTPAVLGTAKGLQNNAVNSTLEQERLLTHLIFAPVLKAANRTLTITYTLTISVARSQTT